MRHEVTNAQFYEITNTTVDSHYDLKINPIKERKDIELNMDHIKLVT